MNRDERKYDLLFKVMLIGDSGVGKTCLLFRYCDDAFSGTFISTIGVDFKIKTLELMGKRIKFMIWDTAGQERFNSITSAYYRGAMGIFLVYDVTDRRSFEQVAKWMRNVSKHANDDVSKMLIGNKSDADSNDRRVSKEAGARVAEDLGVRFMETSAKTNDNVDLAFLTMARLIMDRLESDKAKFQKQESVKLDEKVEKDGVFKKVNCNCK